MRLFSSLVCCCLLVSRACADSFPWQGSEANGERAVRATGNDSSLAANLTSIPADNNSSVPLTGAESSTSSSTALSTTSLLPGATAANNSAKPSGDASASVAQSNDIQNINIPGPAQFPPSNASSTTIGSAAASSKPASQPKAAETISALKIKTLDNLFLPASDNVKFVIVVAGSDNKNPDEFYPGSPLKDEQRGVLTAVGKQQGLSYGNFMRQRYSSFLPSEFNDTDVNLITSSIACAQSTMQAITAGFYAPDAKSEWNPKIKWQPTPYKIDDTIVNTAHAAKCPAMEDVRSTVDKEIELSLGQKKKIIDYVTSQLGSGSSSANLANIGSNFEQMTLRNISLPSFVSNNPFNQNLLPNILGFRFLYQLGCARNAECRHISAGPLLYTIAKDLKSKKDSNLNTKMQLYTTGSDNLAALLWALGVESAGIPSGRSLILEYQEAPAPAIRALFSEFVDQKPEAMSVSVFHLPGCDSKQEWCPINSILKLADTETVADWKKVCRVPETCENSKSIKGSEKDSVGGFNRVNLAIDCASEEDRSGKFFCEQWAKYDYCKDYVSTRDYYCRYTCLCDEKYRVKSI